jgi:hypothetical protein
MKITVSMDSAGGSWDFDCLNDCGQCKVAWYCLTHTPLEFNRYDSDGSYFHKFEFCGVKYEFKDFEHTSLTKIVSKILSVSLIGGSKPYAF